MNAQKEIQLSERTLALVKERAASCFMCKWILKSMDEQRKLRDYPPDPVVEGETVFPVSAQRKHVLDELDTCKNQNQDI